MRSVWLVVVAVAVATPGGAQPPRPVVCPSEMVSVPAGTFMMGTPDGEGDEDEHPQHKVTLRAFCMDKTEVTVAAYSRCVTAGVCTAAPVEVTVAGLKGDPLELWSRFCNGNRSDRQSHPTNCVDWDQANQYCTWAGKRLPTEPEWEYTARGKTGKKYPWGSEPPTGARVNSCGAECEAMVKRAIDRDLVVMYPDDDGWESTAPVGSLPAGASPFGALDMAGNVWEWVADAFETYPNKPRVNPGPSVSGETRVDRGGGWLAGDISLVRGAIRSWGAPDRHLADVGFRCARSE